MHPLKLFFLRNGDWATMKGMAEALGLSLHTLYNICSCRTQVAYDWARKIEDYTKGSVKWQDLIEYNGLRYKTQKKTDTDVKSESVPLVSADSSE